MQNVTEQEVTQTLRPLLDSSSFLIDQELNTQQFATDADNVSWELAHGEVWRRASEIREEVARHPGSRVMYFGGFPEVPLALAFGAYIGEELTVESFDRHRDLSWDWPSSDATLQLETRGLPTERMLTAGPAVVRVEISATIDEDLLRTFVRDSEETAHVQIRPRDLDPMIAERVRSSKDVVTVRSALREALASIAERRPNITAVHLFVAAPPSVCVGVGQELRLRNMPAVELYRYRRDRDGAPTLRRVFRIVHGGPNSIDIPLTDGERQRASETRRSLWGAALIDVEAYAANKRRDRPNVGERWYTRLEPRVELARVHPFPTLPPVYEVIPPRSSVVDESMESGFYGYERDTRRWRVNDRFLLRLETEFDDQREDLRAIVRLFMFHEALHVSHGITKAKVEEVGKFANALEHVDYAADLYAILHELDRGLVGDMSPLHNFEALRDRIVNLIDLVIRSFWAFEDKAPIDRMETRRIRRYLNWYWQQIRVGMADSRIQLAAVLARKPIVEIAGLETSVEGRRHYASLRRVDPNVGLELGIVLDDEELKRVFASVTVPLTELMRAFRDRDHASIRQAFRQVFAEVGEGRALPREGDLV